MHRIILSLFLLVAGLGAGPRRPSTPADNILSARRAALGAQLFFDKRLSANNTVSCSTCHRPDYQFTEPQAVSNGIGGQLGVRRSPTLWNAAYLSADRKAFFWDQHALGLEGQCAGPIENPRELGQQTLTQCAARLDRAYHNEFQAAYGQDCNILTLPAAIASFERTLVINDAPAQRYERGETWALNAEQRQGREVFYATGCAVCHVLPDGRDGNAHFVGAPLQDRTGAIDNGVAKGFFKTPTLLAVSERPPYLHNGLAATVRQAIELHRVLPQPRSEADWTTLLAYLDGFTPEHLPFIEAPVLP